MGKGKCLDLSLTKRCNMRCPNCLWMLEGESYFQNSDMPLKKAKEIITYYRKKMRMNKVILQGEGEVLLYPYLYEVIDFCQRNKVRVRGITTNGLALDSHLKIIKYTGVTISLDGYDADTYSEQRGGDESIFNKVVENVSKLVEYKKENNIESHIGINCIVTENNYEKMEQMIEFSASLGVDSIRFGNYHPIGGDLRPLYNEPNILSHMKKVASKKYNILVKWLALMDKNLKAFHCPMLNKNNFVIGCDGHFSPCCHIHTSEHWGVFPNYSDNYKDFVNQFNSAKSIDELPIKCRECPRLYK